MQESLAYLQEMLSAIRTSTAVPSPSAGKSQQPLVSLLDVDNLEQQSHTAAHSSISTSMMSLPVAIDNSQSRGDQRRAELLRQAESHRQTYNQGHSSYRGHEAVDRSSRSCRKPDEHQRSQRSLSSDSGSPSPRDQHSKPNGSLLKLGDFTGLPGTCLDTFLSRFDNCAQYYRWSERDKLAHLRGSRAGPAGQLLWDNGHISDITLHQLTVTGSSSTAVWHSRTRGKVPGRTAVSTPRSRRITAVTGYRHPRDIGSGLSRA